MSVNPPGRGAACAGFEQWLDAGRPESGAAAARAHPESCRRCAERLAADLAIEALLATPPPSAPAGFTAAVMNRIERAGRARAALPAPGRDALPWWVRVAAEPAVALATVLAGLVTWRGADLAGRIAAASLDFAHRLQGGSLALPAPFDRPGVALALVWVAAPAAVWASWRLYRWGEKVAVRGLRRAFR